MDILSDKKAIRYLTHTICCALLFALALSVAGCGKSDVPPQRAPSASAQKLYLKSQKELLAGNNRQAYEDYQKAVADDSIIANVSHLSSILYSWAIPQCKAEDVPLIKAQKAVWLAPEQLALRKALLAAAVNKKKGVIHAFGMGIIRSELTNREQRLKLAQQTALADAKAWIARLARWTKDGVKAPFDVSQTVMNIETLETFSIQGVFFVVKVSAPLNSNTP